MSTVKPDKEYKFAKAIWNVYHKDKCVDEGEMNFDGFLADKPTFNVGMNINYPIKLSQYEIMKIGVDIHCPCYAEHLDETFDTLQDWVNNKMKELISNIKKQLK